MLKLPLGTAGTRAVTLGEVGENSIAPSMFALVERGAERRPGLAMELRGVVELRFNEGFAPVVLRCAPGGIEVADGPALEPDLVLTGALPDVVALTVAPLLRGWPSPGDPRGRAALARLADGRLRLSGRRALGRQLLRLLAL